MVERYTMKDAESCAKRLAETLGKKFGSCWKKTKDGNVAEVGCWELDHNSIYGGSNINEIYNEGGGVTLPFGEGRMKPEHFCRAVQFAEKAVEIDREKRRK